MFLQCGSIQLCLLHIPASLGPGYVWYCHAVETVHVHLHVCVFSSCRALTVMPNGNPLSTCISSFKALSRLWLDLHKGG